MASNSIWDILTPILYVEVGVQCCPVSKGHDGLLLSEIREMLPGCQHSPNALLQNTGTCKSFALPKGMDGLLSELQSCIHHD